MVTHTYTHTHTHTYTHDNYSNPRCAHARRGLITVKKIKTNNNNIDEHKTKADTGNKVYYRIHVHKLHVSVYVYYCMLYYDVLLLDVRILAILICFRCHNVDKKMDFYVSLKH